MSQDVDLYKEKVAAAWRDIAAAQARIAHVSPSEAAKIKREIAIAQAMLPFMSKLVVFLKLLER